MLFNNKEKLPIVISSLFLIFICLLSVSYDNKQINGLFYISSILYIFHVIKNRKLDDVSKDTSQAYLFSEFSVRVQR